MTKKKITPEMHAANEENIKNWMGWRRQGYLAFGKVRCTYARVFLPREDGSAMMLFSIQKSFFGGGNVIEDCGMSELNQDATKYVFGNVAPCNDTDYLNPEKLHVGKLSDDMWRMIQKYCNGLPSTPYVLFNPYNWTWGTRYAKTPEIDYPSGIVPIGKKAKSVLIPALLAAASMMLD